MKVKELKEMLDKLDDEQEVTIISPTYDGYDRYEIEEDFFIEFYFSKGSHVILIPASSDMGEIKKRFPGGFSLSELRQIHKIIEDNKEWLALLGKEYSDG